MSSDTRGERAPDPDSRHYSESWGPWKIEDEDTQPRPVISSSSQSAWPSTDRQQIGNTSAPEPVYPEVDPQFTHREHITGALPGPSLEAPLFRVPYPPYQVYPQQAVGYPPPQAQGQGFPSFQTQWYPPYAPNNANPTAQPGYPPYVPYGGFPGYPMYPFQPARPRRDRYLLGIAWASFIGSILLVFAGLGCLFLLSLFTFIPNKTLTDSEYFASIAFFISLIVAGILGGSFSLYHSIRSAILNKPSAHISFPTFWLFVGFYLIVIGAGFILKAQKDEVAFPVLTMVLIILAGVLPALGVLALGIRRLRFPQWPTSWRRFTLALVSGATSGILLATILEFAIQAVIVRGQSTNILLCIDRPDATNCQTPGVYGLLFIIVALVGPVVEETVKPLGAVFLITRIRSAAEAFVLGLACGIGFDLVETVGYISSGYHDWLNVALIRTSAGLLHGFGAAMVTLGLYYLTHGKRYRFLLAFAYWLYAVVQHAIWNGSWGLTLLPAPIGPAIDSWNVNLGFTLVPFYLVINFAEVLIMLVFFIYITGRLRKKTPPAGPAPEMQAGMQSIREQRAVVGM